MADNDDDDDLLNDLDFDKIAEDKKEKAAGAADADFGDDFDDMDIPDLDDDLLSSDDLMDDLDDADMAALDEELAGDDEDWDLGDDDGDLDDDFDAGPAQLSAPKKKGGFGKSAMTLLLLLGVAGGGGYYYTEYYLPAQNQNVAPQQNQVAQNQPAQQQTNTPESTIETPFDNSIPDLAAQTELPPMPTPVAGNTPDLTMPQDSTDLAAALDQGMDTPDNGLDIDLNSGTDGLTPMPGDTNELPNLTDMDIPAVPAEPPSDPVAGIDVDLPTDAAPNEPEVFDPFGEEGMPAGPDADIDFDLGLDTTPTEPAPAPVPVETAPMPDPAATPDPVIPTPAPAPVETVDNGQAEELAKLNEELAQKNEELAQNLQSKDSKINDLNKTIQDLEKRVASLSEQAKSQASAAPVKTPVKSSSGSSTKTPVKSTQTRSASAKVDWQLRAAQPGKATIAPRGSNDLRTVEVGDKLSGIGKIVSINNQNGRWVVQGTTGSIQR